MTVLGGPAVTSSERKALTGVGNGLGDGDGLGLGEADAVSAGLGEGDEPSAVRSNHRGRKTRTRSERMKPGNDSRRRLVTPEARESTRPRWALGSASHV